MRHAIAVDGGNSKTDVALVREDGEVLATARGVGGSPYHLGVDGSLGVIGGLLEQTGASLPVEAAELLLAGVDFPSEEEAVRAGIERRGWAQRVAVDNDTFAVLRAGTDAGWGVAVVCGAGINCAGRSSAGGVARYPSLGWETGDWGGSVLLGREVLSHAARAEDGRGEPTALRDVVGGHFGLSVPEVGEALRYGRVPPQ